VNSFVSICCGVCAGRPAAQCEKFEQANRRPDVFFIGHHSVLPTAPQRGTEKNRVPKKRKIPPFPDILAEHTLSTLHTLAHSCDLPPPPVRQKETTATTTTVQCAPHRTAKSKKAVSRTKNTYAHPLRSHTQREKKKNLVVAVHSKRWRCCCCCHANR
jgi:hypothetical protein